MDATYDREWTQEYESALVDRLVNHCLEADRAPKPARKARAIIVVREDGSVVVRHRSARTGWQWASKRCYTMADAYNLQATLISG